MTYVFRCSACKHEFETTSSVSEYESRGAPACPRCGRAARRVFTPVLVMSAAGKDAPSSSSGGCGCGGACSCGH
jgi:putative FmdB family regulatory protein